MRHSEHALQVAVAHMLTVVLDPDRTWWSGIDHGAGKMSKAAGGMMKARGVKRGLPDIIILTHFDICGAAGAPFLLGIELKSEKGRSTPDQLLVADKWLEIGGSVHACFIEVAHSLEEVQDILERNNIPMCRRMTFFGGDHERRERLTAPRHPRARPARRAKGRVPMVQRRPPQEV